MKHIHILAFALAASVGSFSLADEASSSGPIIAPGQQTDAWLNAQSKGTMASENIQAAKGIQRDKAAERFMKTYDFPIKESYYGKKFTPGS